jgi:hypothetical protein
MLARHFTTPILSIAPLGAMEPSLPDAVAGFSLLAARHQACSTVRSIAKFCCVKKG